jgi:predicted DNA-binding transcriptional regulator YafY
MDVSPTARTLRTLDLIHRRPGIRAEELARELGVSERAVRRYVSALRDADVPVNSTLGRDGGYRIGRGVRLPPVVFSGPEALALVMSVLDSPAGAPPEDSLAGTGVAKLPASVGRPAEQFWQHVETAPAGMPHPDVEIMSALVEALATARQVRLSYTGATGNSWSRDVDPWAVVVRFGLWYLLCRIPSGELRTYRVDRVEEVAVLPQVCEVPADLDAVAVLERSLGEGWPYAVRIRFQASTQQVRPWIRAPMGHLEDHGETCVLVGTTRNTQMYANEWLAQVPYDFVVEDGPELRAAIAELARRLSAAVAS